MDTKLHEDQPLVSVVMCAYNARPYIEAAVGCIINQTYRNWQLIIADDCSTDGTREWLAGRPPDARIHIILNQKNLGYVANKNNAHLHAEGIYITQMDNDDLCSTDRLEKQVAVFLQHPGAMIVASGYNRIDYSGTVYGTIAPEQEGWITAKGTADYPFWFPGLLVHRDVFKKVGYYPEYFAGTLGDDLYWAMKANRHYKIYCLKEALYSYRNNPGSITNVLDNEKKLIMPAIMDELIRQEMTIGTDWLEQKDDAALLAFEEKLLADKPYLAEQYRIWAAKAIDKQHKSQASALLKKAFKLNGITLPLFRTYIYLVRKTI